MFQPAMSVPQKLVQARQYPVHASPNAFRPATYPDIMTTLEMLIDVLFRSRERFDRAFDGVTLEQANTQPTPDLAPRIDSLTWLAWHTARELDIQVAATGSAAPPPCPTTPRTGATRPRRPPRSSSTTSPS